MISAVATAIAAVDGVRLLDQTSDADHNRSVFTFAGEPDAVERAAHALVDVSLREIDMRAHKGEHPRLGAVDVVPFVPVSGISMDECVALAHRFGRDVAARHRVPVYFYANAALRPDRVKLGDIRNKVQYEGLAEALATTHVPDAGPSSASRLLTPPHAKRAPPTSSGTSTLTTFDEPTMHLQRTRY